MLTQDRIRKLFNYDKVTGLLTRRAAVANRTIESRVGWVDSCGYLRVSIDNKKYLVHCIIWLWLYGYFPENDIDHINRDALLNTPENLREVSHQCNLRNTSNHRDNKSGVKGVSWHAQRNKWRATISVNRSQKHLGLHKDFDDAVCARLAAEQCLDWAGCDSESPAYSYVRNLLNG